MTISVDKIFHDIKEKYSSFEHFQQEAIKLLNELWGRAEKLATFDFYQDAGRYIAVGYHAAEPVPETNNVGDQIPDHIQAILNDKLASVDQPPLSTAPVDNPVPTEQNVPTPETAVETAPAPQEDNADGNNVGAADAAETQTNGSDTPPPSGV